MKRLWATTALCLLGCGTTQLYEPGAPPRERGIIRTIAGTGTLGYSGDDGPALAADFSFPVDTLTAADGTMYIVDWNNNRIRKLTTDGTVRHVAGTGDYDTGSLNHPSSVAFDPSGKKLLISAWFSGLIDTLDLASGQLSATGGNGRRGYAGDGLSAATATLDLPTGLAFGPRGTLVLMDQENQVLRSIDGQGVIHRLAGECIIDWAFEGSGSCAPGTAPVACPDGSGKSTCGDPSTCNRACAPAYAGDEGPALQLRMAQPMGDSAAPGGHIVFDPAGSLIFADTGNSLIRKIDAAGIVHRVAGTPPGTDGTPVHGYAGDEGPATLAVLNNPVDLALADDGTLYFTDVYNHCVRSISTDGVIHTVAGICGQLGFAGDGGPASQALLKRPYGVEVHEGVLHIADTGNNVIRSLNL